MKQKISYLIAAVLVLSGFAFFSLAKADNNSNDNMGHAKEVRNTGSSLEVHFYDNGSVLVRGAKVTAISGNVVNASMSWGSSVLNWTVNLSASSKVVRKFGGVASVSEIAVGDILSFQGNLDTTNTSPFTVNASTVKNWSIQKKMASFNGTVKSVDSTGMKFVLTSGNRGDVTVVVASSTQFKKEEGNSTALTFANIIVGAQVTARGVLDTVSNQLTANDIRIKQSNSGGDSNSNQGNDNNH